MTSLPLACVFQCLFTFALVSASRRLGNLSLQLSRRGAIEEMVVEFNFQRRCCKLSFLFSPRRQSARESLLVGYHVSNLDGATHYSRWKGVGKQIRTGFLTKHLDKLLWSCGVTT